MNTGRLLNIVLFTMLLITAGCDPGTGNTSEGTVSHEHQQVDRHPKQERQNELASGLQHIQSVKDTAPGKQVNEPFPDVRVVIQQNRGANPSTVTMYSNEKRIHSYQNHQFHRLHAYRFRETGYVFVEMWEGGMHCCFPTTVYSVSGDDVRHLHTFELGHAYFDPERDLLTRSGDLYYRMPDDRFAHHRLSLSSSIYIHRYFKLTPEGIQEVNERFRTAYLEEAKQHRNRLMHQLRTANVDVSNDPSSDTLSLWFPHLLGYTVNLLMAGKRDRAWDGFHRLYNKIQNRHPAWLQNEKRAGIKQYIRERMNK